MRIGSEGGAGSLFDLMSSRSNSEASRADTTAGKVPATAEEGLERVEEAKENAYNTTMRTWDKHTDMVEKSQKLRQIRNRKEAIERQNTERREEQTELMAKIAIENANRSSLLEADAMKRKAKESSLAA
ncbi:MAG: hypothetical protein K6E38_06910 [Fretibacterium sp.]|nr:hypothetical protein [Fretibacterium sp.]